MPQGGRKVPFSGKQKKQQLIHKRQDKSGPINLIRKINETESEEGSECAGVLHNVQKINMQPIKDPRSKSNKYVLQFHNESPKDLKRLKEQALHGLQYATEEQSEIDDSYFEGFDFPKRPEWGFNMSKETLLATEERYFFKYITNIEKNHYDDMKQMSYFELNLETWRQLWRVIEISDVILMIVDARFPSLMFPQSLFNYVTKELKKYFIIVLNKIDLVDAPVVLAWKKYFEQEYPSIHVVLFTSLPAYNLRGNSQNKTGLKIRRRRGRMRMASEGALQVYQACQAIVKDQVDLANWQKKIQDEMATSSQIEDDDDEDDSVKYEGMHEEVKDFDFEKHELFKNGVLTIGCVGFPNVGKSSLLNALMGKKVVSVSRTPGHTKHFQTIFLTNTVRLCDCPGLVFPSQVPRSLQVLMGSYPIAQLREPYASIRYLAERIDIPNLLAMQHPEGKGEEWSAMDICDAFAIKRGFYTAKAARPDSYRAANSILRMALDGKITLSLKPRGYCQRKEYWESHEELEKVLQIQVLGKVDSKNDAYEYSDSDGEGTVQRPAEYQMKKDFKRTSNDVAKEESSDDSDEDQPPSRAPNPFALLDNSME